MTDSERGWPLSGERARLVANRELRGRAFGVALAGALDEAFRQLLETVRIRGRWVLVAMGSYGRRELSPGSDVDVMLVVDDGRANNLEDAARGLWYPLWDAGFALGHSVRTAKDALRLAGGDLEALTSLLDARGVAGDRTLAGELDTKARRLAARRRDAMVTALAGTADARRAKPGPIAEMLEPDLKGGSGGLRDLQALDWVGCAFDDAGPAGLGGPGGLGRLVELGYLEAEDRNRLASSRDELLDARLALHRVTGGRSDLLTLQEQDAVAAELGADDADTMIRSLAAAGRVVAWISADTWTRLRSTLAGPARRGARPRTLADGVVLRDGRIALGEDGPVDALTVLHAAGAAAQQGVPFERGALQRCAGVSELRWRSEERDAFVTLLAAGDRAIPVFEALDHVGVLGRFLPEWDHVRSRPQRNAYHRFTVDRHLLEAVAECATLRAEAGFDGEVARRCRPDLLLLGALLHDIGKGAVDDHSAVSAETARVVGRRMGFDAAEIETLVWLVRYHLLLADTATRRDLTDETTVLRFGRAVGTGERLDLLYALTIGDSRATGPAAWSAARAKLVRELYLRADALLQSGIVDPSLGSERRAQLAARRDALLAAGVPAIGWRHDDSGLLEVTVVARDEPGLLARVAGALAVLGIDIRDADACSEDDGVAVEVFLGEDRFGRLVEESDRAKATALLEAVANDEVDMTAELRARRERYRRPPGVVTTRVDLDASAGATVVEVEAPDEVGLLATVASVFTDLGFDVTLAKVQTLGDRVIDVFYVRGADGEKVTDRLTLDRLRATIVARLTTEYSLPAR